MQIRVNDLTKERLEKLMKLLGHQSITHTLNVAVFTALEQEMTKQRISTTEDQDNATTNSQHSDDH